jgi:hypothetical protein
VVADLKNRIVGDLDFVGCDYACEARDNLLRHREQVESSSLKEAKVV